MNIDKYVCATLDDLSNLSFFEKVIVGVALLKIQSKAIRAFDRVYGERLLPLYDEVVEFLILASCSAGIEQVNGVSPADIYERIPDVDEFPTYEGSFAQIAMISAWYLFSFYIDKSQKHLRLSLDSYFDYVDMENQVSKEPVSDEVLFKQTAAFIHHLLREISSNDIYDEATVTAVIERALLNI